VTVRVIFSKRTAPYIRERLWHPSEKLRDLDDGRLESHAARGGHA
jgi:hypothetical protein